MLVEEASCGSCTACSLPLGRDDSPSSSFGTSWDARSTRGSSNSHIDTENADAWASLIFLADLYNQTIGRHESLGTNDLASSSSRNPLALGELKLLSRQLLIIPFQREGPADWHKGSIAPNVRFTWGNVTQCAVTIHSRQYVCSKSFVPRNCIDHSSHSHRLITGSPVLKSTWTRLSK